MKDKHTDRIPNQPTDEDPIEEEEEEKNLFEKTNDQNQQIDAIQKNTTERLTSFPITEIPPEKPVDIKNQDNIEQKDLKFLNKEQIEKTLSILKIRFDEHPKRHKGVEWEKVKKTLEKNRKALWSIFQMEKEGHEPDIYSADKEGFDIGTCCQELSERNRNIVYDAEAEKICSKETNGNAADITRSMGIDIITEEQYKKLQKPGKNDRDTCTWLKTPDKIKKTNAALAGFRYLIVQIGKREASNPNIKVGVRGTLRVLWNYSPIKFRGIKKEE